MFFDTTRICVVVVMGMYTVFLVILNRYQLDPCTGMVRVDVQNDFSTPCIAVGANEVYKM